MTTLDGLDHVAILVGDTEAAVERFTNGTGLRVVHQEELAEPPVRLTYLDAGNAFVQLLEPLVADSSLGRHLQDQGEGLHHLCFSCSEPIAAAAQLASVPPSEVVPGTGRGRVSAFVPGPLWHGVCIECTETGDA